MYVEKKKAENRTARRRVRGGEENSECVKEGSVVANILSLSKEDCENVKIMDREGGLVLVHYISPSQFVSHLRGVIVDTDKKQVVCYSFPYTKEFSVDNKNLRFFNFEGSIATYAYEGTILRVFYDDSSSRWRISTHRKIDGTKSKWCGGEFGTIFEKLWGDKNYDDYLERRYCYAFLLVDPTNKLICENREEKLYLVGIFEVNPSEQNFCHTKVRNILLEDPSSAEKLFTNKGVSMVERYGYESGSDNSGTRKNICDSIRDNDEMLSKKATGVLVYFRNGKYVKIVPPTYEFLRDVRGNDKNPRNRYIRLFLDEVQESVKGDKESFLKLKTLEGMFPERKEEFRSLYEMLHDIIPVDLANSFMIRYAEGKYHPLERNAYNLLEEVYRNYDEEYTVEDNIRMNMPRAGFYCISCILDDKEKR